MNTLEFVIRRILRSFGIVNERSHLHIASQQTQYLNEAEDMLGRIAWKDVGEIPELSEEFWKLKEIETQQEALKGDITSIEQTNEALTEERDQLDLKSEEQLAGITGKKTEAMRLAIAQMHDVEESRSKAELTKKQYSGLRIKLKLLTEGGEPEEERAAVRDEMERLKLEYAANKKEIESLTKKIQETEAEVARIEEEIETLRGEAREKMAEMMNRVSRSSRLVAEYTARIGSLESTKRDLAAKVGSFLSANYRSGDPDLKPVLKKYHSILAKIAALRVSIHRHRLIAGRDTVDA